MTDPFTPETTLIFPAGNVAELKGESLYGQSRLAMAAVDASS